MPSAAAASVVLRIRLPLAEQAMRRSRAPVPLMCMAAVLAVTMIAGCAPRQPYVNQARLERGLVIVLPGIEGGSVLNRAICRGLDEGGVNTAIELYDWTSRLGPLYNLRAKRRNRRVAGEIADRIVRYQAEYPDRPVLLVGQSGGGAMAVWAIEALPPGSEVDGAVLLSASLSPRYNLDEALSNTRRGIVNFHSRRDWFLLGVGTTLAGTMDGEHASSAGRTGFVPPKDIPVPDNYTWLFQIPWREEMAETGHVGGHLSASAAGFISTYVAPFVITRQWNRQLVHGVISREWFKAGQPGGNYYRPE